MLYRSNSDSRVTRDRVLEGSVKNGVYLIYLLLLPSSIGFSHGSASRVIRSSLLVFPIGSILYF